MRKRVAALVAAFAALAALVLAISSPAHAQPGPTITRVEPPNWWVGHSINPVRLLIRGRALRGARVACGRLSCSRPTITSAGTYAFVDVTIPSTAKAGAYPLTLRTAAGDALFDFTVQAPLPRTGRFQGFGSDDVIYLIMPDRFANGDTTNDDPARSRGLFDRKDPRAYHGGDIEGVRRHLPYLKELGVTTIWLTPIYDNVDTVAHRRRSASGKSYTDYHGYGAIDFYGVEEHFGDIATFRRLVDDAHRLGLKVILDMVANHTGPEHAWVADPPTPTWYHGTTAKHLPNNWQIWTIADRYAAPAVRDSTLDGWFGNHLPDLNQDDPEVARYIVQNTLWWAGVSGLDGIRQDTWPYVPRRFWKQWMAAIKREYPTMRVVGEMWDSDPSLVAFFEGGRAGWDGLSTGVDYLFDFPLYFPVRRAFAEGKSVREVAQMVAHDRLYLNPTALVTFAGNHDTQRFMNEPGATEAGARLAYTFLLTARGIPMLYSGDEIALRGGGDPDNRRDFPGGWVDDARSAFEIAGRDSAQQAVWAHVQRLLRLRAERPELRRARTEHLLVDNQTYVYRRGATVIAINNDTKPVTLRLPLGALKDDALGICRRPATDAGTTILVVPPRAGCIF